MQTDIMLCLCSRILADTDKRTDKKYTVLNTILLDVQYEGMKAFLQDFGWSVKTITEVSGPTTEDRNDDNIMAYAKANPDVVIVTQDKQLIQRLENMNCNVCAMTMPSLAACINTSLSKRFRK